VQDKIDLRVVRVSIEVNGKLRTYEDLAITATGMKFANANQNECEIKIANLNKETRDFILTETSPFNKNRTPKIVTLEAGRVSYETTRIFAGNVVSATPSQPPDITVTLKCLTGNFQKGNLISRSQAGNSQLRQVSEQTAKDLGLALDYQAKDKTVSNYAYSGAALQQVNKIGELGAVNAYVDDGVLVVKDFNVPLSNRLRKLSLETGMIGIPEITEQGIKVKFGLDNFTVLGGALEVKSVIYPSANGTYVIYKLGFEISNRDQPFCWIAEAKRI